MLRTLVLDRQRAVSQLLATALRTDPSIDVVGWCDHAAPFAELLEHHPAVVVVDEASWRDPDVRSRAAEHDARAVVLTATDEAPALAAALRLGATGVLAKAAPVPQLLAAVHAVAETRRWIPAEHLDAVLTNLLDPHDAATDDERRVARLTPRETEVLRLLVEGVGREEIARRLFISRHTVRSHVGHILGKLGVPSVVSAVALAVRTGLGPPTPS